MNRQPIGKRLDAQKDQRQEKMASEDEMAGGHPCEHESEQTLGDSEGQGRLVCYSLWGCKESDMI